MVSSSEPFRFCGNCSGEIFCNKSENRRRQNTTKIKYKPLDPRYVPILTDRSCQRLKSKQVKLGEPLFNSGNESVLKATDHLGLNNSLCIGYPPESNTTR